ncbi:membrane protein [Agaricicola taiwanensis]|uniref:Membrane protein n=1 Tax=Agaricicola taiwanensis TaxID=591372 RepID=A0A8J2VXP7_9RHOB|nr:AsmA-like C-terminal region-containing protein [Agaricicola taiwanensis]GGE42497.1 membrane protein [Agaricicola taiwanensis]
MNTILTTIAAALVLALGAALIGPYFVDWTAYRAEFEARASQIVGTPVHVRGSVEARLLPHPSISFNDVEMGAPGEKARLEATSFSLRLFPAPLLRGEVHVRDVDVVAPRLTVEIGPDGELALPLEANSLQLVDPAKVTLERIGITQGVLVVLDPETGRSEKITGILGQGSASSLMGPFKFEGRGIRGSKAYDLKLATGRFAGERMQTRLELTSDTPARDLLLDGFLSFSGLRPSFQGRAVLTRAATDTTIESWRIEGRLVADPRTVRIDDFSLQLGPDDRALRLEGFGDLALGARPQGKVTLSARQLDVDRLLGPGDQPRTPRQSLEMLLSRLERPASGMPLAVELKTDGLLISQELIQNVDLAFETAGGDGSAIAVRKAQARFPGGARAAVAGRLAMGPGGPTFKGRAETDVRDWPQLARWLGGTDRLPGISTISFLGDVEASASRVELSQATLSLDGETAEGRVVWERKGGAASLAAAVTAERLDLDAIDLPGLSRSIEVASAVDLALDAKAIRYAGLDARGVSINLVTHGRDLTVRRFALDDVGGAKVDVSGDLEIRSGAVSGMLSGRISARELDGIAALLRKSPLPDAVAEGFADRAAVLAPMDAEVVFGADPEKAGGVLLRAKGTAGGSVVDAQLKLDAPAADATIEARASVNAAEANRLLQQLGFPVVSLESGGPGRLVLGARGLLAKAVATRLEVDMLETDLDAHGDLAFAGGELKGVLQTSLASADISRLMSRFGRLPPVTLDSLPIALEARLDLSKDRMAFSDIEGMVDGRAVAGRLAFAGGGWRTVSGALQLARLDLSEAMAMGLGPLAFDGPAREAPWPSGPVAPGPFDGFTGQIGLSLEEVGLPMVPSLRAAKATLVLAPREARFDQVSGEIAGGRLEAALGLSLLDEGMTLKTTINVTNADLSAVLWQGADGKAAVVGQGNLSMDVQGSGPTIAEAVGGLSGGGSLTLRDVTIAGLDPTAFSRIRTAAEQGLDLAPASIAKAFSAEAAKDDLTITEATGAFSVAGGTVRLSNMAVDAPAATISALATLDLARLHLQSTIGVGPQTMDEIEPSALPRVSLNFTGRLTEPRREVDVTGLSSFLTGEAIEREVKRIHELEDAAHERARLRREMDARDQQRRAEEERRRAAARRAEQERMARQAPALPPPLEIGPPPGARAPVDPFSITPSEGQGPLILSPQIQPRDLPLR